jgi:hypothetical protein
MTLRLHPEHWAGSLVSYLGGRCIRYQLTFLRRNLLRRNHSSSRISEPSIRFHSLNLQGRLEDHCIAIDVLLCVTFIQRYFG